MAYSSCLVAPPDKVRLFDAFQTAIFQVVEDRLDSMHDLLHLAEGFSGALELLLEFLIGLLFVTLVWM